MKPEWHPCILIVSGPRSAAVAGLTLQKLGLLRGAIRVCEDDLVAAAANARWLRSSDGRSAAEAAGWRVTPTTPPLAIFHLWDLPLHGRPLPHTPPLCVEKIRAGAGTADPVEFIFGPANPDEVGAINDLVAFANDSILTRRYYFSAFNDDGSAPEGAEVDEAAARWLALLLTTSSDMGGGGTSQFACPPKQTVLSIVGSLAVFFPKESSIRRALQADAARLIVSDDDAATDTTTQSVLDMHRAIDADMDGIVSALQDRARGRAPIKGVDALTSELLASVDVMVHPHGRVKSVKYSAVSKKLLAKVAAVEADLPGALPEVTNLAARVPGLLERLLIWLRLRPAPAPVRDAVSERAHADALADWRVQAARIRMRAKRFDSVIGATRLALGEPSGAIIEAGVDSVALKLTDFTDSPSVGEIRAAVTEAVSSMYSSFTASDVDNLMSLPLPPLRRPLSTEVLLSAFPVQAGVIAEHLANIRVSARPQGQRPRATFLLAYPEDGHRLPESLIAALTGHGHGDVLGSVEMPGLDHHQAFRVLDVPPELLTQRVN